MGIPLSEGVEESATTTNLTVSGYMRMITRIEKVAI
jgi:hypothetical protein